MKFRMPTLLIGLGGTGLKTVAKVKEKLAPYLKDTKLIKFLVLDSDKNERALKVLAPDEYINIGVPGIGQILQNLDTPSNKYIKPWFPKDIPFKVMSGDEGAKQFRPIGRVYLFKNIDKVFNQVDVVVKSLRAALVGPEDVSKTINVFMISSICGGTGSGILLDMAYIVRHVVEVENASPLNLQAFLILPTAFHPFPVKDETEKQHLFANGYGALKEIDYFMDPMRNTTFEVQYSETRRVSSSKQPFDVCYLIDDENEEFPIGGLQDTIEVLAESIIIRLGAGLGTSLKSAEDNLFTIMNQARARQPHSDKNYSYSSIGSASIIYPYELVLQYLIGKLMSAFEAELKATAQEEEIWDIISTLQVDEVKGDDIIDSIYSEKFGYSELVEKLKVVPNRELAKALDSFIGSYLRAIEDDVKPEMDSNLDKLIKTKREELRRVLDERLANPSWGFYKLLSAMQDEKYGLFSYVENAKEMMRREAEEFERRLGKLERDIASFKEMLIAKSSGFFANLFNRKDMDILTSLGKAVAEYANSRIEIERRIRAIKFYNSFKTELEHYKMNVLDKYVDVWNRFKNKFIKRYLDVHFEDKVTAWGLKINYYITDPPMYDKLVYEYLRDEGREFKAQMFRLFDNFKEFDYDNLEKYDERIYNWVRDVFGEKIKANIEYLAVRKLGSEDDVLKLLKRSSTGLFRYWIQDFDPALLKKYTLLGVPDRESSRFLTLAQAMDIEVIETGDPYKLSMLQVKHGFPLFCFVMLPNMRDAYNALVKREPGLHIDWRFRNLPEPALEALEDVQDVYEMAQVFMAFRLQVVRKEGINYVIELDGERIELGHDKLEAVNYLMELLRDKEHREKFQDLLKSHLPEEQTELLKKISEIYHKAKSRFNYLNSKKSLSSEEESELEILEREVKVMDKFYRTLKA